jgi:hypothetical protein
VSFLEGRQSYLTSEQLSQISSESAAVPAGYARPGYA